MPRRERRCAVSVGLIPFRAWACRRLPQPPAPWRSPALRTRYQAWGGWAVPPLRRQWPRPSRSWELCRRPSATPSWRRRSRRSCPQRSFRRGRPWRRTWARRRGACLAAAVASRSPEAGRSLPAKPREPSMGRRSPERTRRLPEERCRRPRRSRCRRRVAVWSCRPAPVLLPNLPRGARSSSRRSVSRAASLVGRSVRRDPPGPRGPRPDRGRRCWQSRRHHLQRPVVRPRQKPSFQSRAGPRRRLRRLRQYRLAGWGS